MKLRPSTLLLAAALALAPSALAASAQLVLKHAPASATPTRPKTPASLSPDPKTNFAVTQSLNVAGDGNWTHALLDDAGKFLYVPRLTHTQVIDTATGKVAADIAPARLATAVALVPDANRGFITNLGGGNLTVFDLKTNAVLGAISVPQNPSQIIYDPASKRLLVACQPNLLVPVPPNLDLKTGKPDPPIQFDGPIAGLVADNQGTVYATVTAKDEVAVLDTRIMKVVTTWPLGEWHNPTAITIDRTHGRLFVTFRSSLAVMSAADGHIIGEVVLRTTPPWKFPDSVAEYFDGHIFSACGDGSMTILGQNPDGLFEVQQMLPLDPNARPPAIDPHSGKIFLPAIKKDNGKFLPATFKLLVVQKKTQPEAH